MPTGRQLIQCFLEGSPMSRPAFVPLVRGLAARVGGVKAELFTSDPTAWSNLLVKTVELFNLDGVVAGVDFTILAEACGCPVAWQDDRPRISGPAGIICPKPEETARFKVALEKARMLFTTTRPERACVATMTGPVTLAAQLLGRKEGPSRLKEIKALAVSAVEAFCATRPDVLIFLEGRALAQGKIGIPQRKIYNTLRNLAAHYDIPTGLFLHGYEQEPPAGLPNLKMDFHILGASAKGSPPSWRVLTELADRGLGLGVGLPLSDPAAAQEALAQGVRLYRERSGRGVFFTSLGPATREANLESIHQLVKEISRVRL
jgi:hypothetical protein